MKGAMICIAGAGNQQKTQAIDVLVPGLKEIVELRAGERHILEHPFQSEAEKIYSISTTNICGNRDCQNRTGIDVGKNGDRYLEEGSVSCQNKCLWYRDNGAKMNFQ